jgi:DNA adenine methylase
MKPIVKYVGGKTWLAPSLSSIIKKIDKFDSYGEAFFGGGGSFFGIVDELNCSTVHINDISVPIISLYNDVINSPEGLIVEYAILEEEFTKFCSDKFTTKEEMGGCNEFFNFIKKEFNKIKNVPSVSMSAKFMFLQQHSFNGLYRENRKGEYNTPFNWKAKPFNIDEMAKRIDDARAIFNRFDRVIISNNDVFDLDTSKGLWYFDPPYLDDGSGMMTYNESGFNLNQHKRLAYKVLTCENFIYSNHPNTEIEEIFNGCSCEIVGRRNIMSSDPNARNQLRNEILIHR